MTKTDPGSVRGRSRTRIKTDMICSCRQSALPKVSRELTPGITGIETGWANEGTRITPKSPEDTAATLKKTNERLQRVQLLSRRSESWSRPVSPSQDLIPSLSLAKRRSHGGRHCHRGPEPYRRVTTRSEIHKGMCPTTPRH